MGAMLVAVEPSRMPGAQSEKPLRLSALGVESGSCKVEHGT